MTVDDAVKVLEAISKLVGALAWPAILLYILIRFGSTLGDFFKNLSEFSLKGAGFEATAKRASVAAALTAAAVSRKADGAEGATPREARIAAELVAEAVTPTAIKRASTATILWVDDNPDNNVYERQSLEALGVTFKNVTSTEAALAEVMQRPFDVIISNMGRPPDSQAGYTLLDALRRQGNKTPFIIYAGSRAPAHRRMAQEKGAVDCTNRPDELFEFVVKVLEDRHGVAR